MADHLSFAIQRQKNNMQFDNPLSSEVMHLYQKEVAIGREGICLINKRFGIRLPESEAVSIALHIINAEALESDMQTTVRDTKILAGIIKIIEDEYKVKLSSNTKELSRLKVHVFALLRNYDQRSRNNKDSSKNKNIH